MPRKPTIVARAARERIIETVAQMPDGSVLPTTRELGDVFDLHPSTIFRMLRDLATEGHVWQGPNGRFYPAGGQSEALKGAALCFIGREMWQWSRLYQEILEGVSEVCSANGSPLILLSSPGLVRQGSATEAPEYSSPQGQQAELERLRETLPRGCAGYLFDHLWHPKGIEQVFDRGAPAVQLLRESELPIDTMAPDAAAGARLVAEHLADLDAEVYLVRPFEGDPAIDAMLNSLRDAFGQRIKNEVPLAKASAMLQSPSGQGGADPCYICPEDNAAHELQALLAAKLAGTSPTPRVVGTQGTGLLAAPTWRLRYDYRRLGRSAAARILHGTTATPIQPNWIQGDGK